MLGAGKNLGKSAERPFPWRFIFLSSDRPYDTLLTGPQLYPLRRFISKFIRSHPLCGAAHLVACPVSGGNNPSVSEITDTAEANYAEKQPARWSCPATGFPPQIYGRFWYLTKPIFSTTGNWQRPLPSSVQRSSCALPAAIMGTASLLFTYWFSRKVYGEKIGWLSALIFGVSVETWILSKSVITDTTLYLFMSAAVALLLSGICRKQEVLLPLLCGSRFATLTKGPIGILLPGLGCVLFLLYKKDIREMLHVHLISASSSLLSSELPGTASCGISSTE